MKIGNLGKAIAFASLWFYCAFVSAEGIEHFYEKIILFIATAAFSVYVIYLFDSKPNKK
tara:strand:+ start:602 stop:778 length:177 start_codon:yes stop_codon:yes gene_type:complete